MEGRSALMILSADLIGALDAVWTCPVWWMIQITLRWRRQDRLNDGSVEDDQQLLWKIGLLLWKFSLCWTFFQIVSMCEEHLRSRDWVVPRNRKWSTADRVLRMVRGGSVGGVLWKALVFRLQQVKF
ncbi:hypothetical protein ATANTOWER_027621 [Ataeniobius toweri]|uniref:Uncharacterized protein n=1 Tax=Ataeniobius toweri TaxID=208326 RepID=A0ABU7A913_9TELE|nr:hypothetical protein [Ataeniobius toweri]